MKIYPIILIHSKTITKIISPPAMYVTRKTLAIDSVSSHLRPSFCSHRFKRGRGNTSSNTSRGCVARGGGAQELKGKGEDVKRLKEMKGTI